MTLTFNKTYFTCTTLIFTIEVLIALFVRDSFIRPYFGDVLVVILLYCFVRSFFHLPVVTLTLCVLIFSFVIEFLQYIAIIKTLGLERSAIARTVIGTSFAWNDIWAYTAGAVIILVAEKFLIRTPASTQA